MMNTLKLFAFLVCFMIASISIVQARNKGFTFEIFHRDSPRSPFYNHSDTNSNRLRNAIVRSMSRANHFHLSSSSSQLNTIQSDVLQNGGDYLMKFSIGTPPVNVLAILDTGSSLVWTQCKPCPNCYKQDAPLFDSSQSSTYKDISCDTTSCQALQPNSRCFQNNTCEYRVLYGDGSYTFGLIAYETITFDSSTGESIPIPNFLFGCGHADNGIFNSRGSGIVGLAGGPLSLVSQLSSQTGEKFSYCLVPRFDSTTSKLKFGDSAILSRQGKVSTPLIRKPSDTHYYLTLEGISVGDQRIDGVSTGSSEGNIVIDSGTTLTLINEDLYTKMESLVKSTIKGAPVPSPSSSLRLCYNNADLMVPEITFHFTGADVKLGQMNTVLKLSEELVCLSIVPADISIFGNIAQVNFQVEYDLGGKQVSFAPTDCTKL